MDEIGLVSQNQMESIPQLQLVKMRGVFVLAIMLRMEFVAGAMRSSYGYAKP